MGIEDSWFSQWGNRANEAGEGSTEEAGYIDSTPNKGDGGEPMHRRKQNKEKNT